MFFFFVSWVHRTDMFKLLLVLPKSNTFKQYLHTHVVLTFNKYPKYNFPIVSHSPHSLHWTHISTAFITLGHLATKLSSAQAYEKQSKKVRKKERSPKKTITFKIKLKPSTSTSKYFKDTSCLAKCFQKTKKKKAATAKKKRCDFVWQLGYYRCCQCNKRGKLLFLILLALLKGDSRWGYCFTENI